VKGFNFLTDVFNLFLRFKKKRLQWTSNCPYQLHERGNLEEKLTKEFGDKKCYRN
jgi:hypothetical protein